MPTVDNVNNWFHARDVEFEHGAFSVVGSHRLYPILGYVQLSGSTFPAAWDFTGLCVLLGSNQDRTTLRKFDLLPIDRQQAWLAEELADLWKYVEPEFKWCVINQDKHPVFWTHRPVFDSKTNAWWKSDHNVLQKISCFDAVRVGTDLPIKMTLQERPVED